MKKTSKLLAFIIVFAMIASCVVLPISVSAASTNLLTNPGFETGNTNSWSVHGNVETGTVSAESAHTGDYGIKIVPKSNATVANQILKTEDISVQSGEYYYLSAWLRAEENKTEKAFVRLQKSVDANVTFYTENAKALTTDWTQLQGIAHVKTGGTVFMTAQLNTDTGTSDNRTKAYIFEADDYEMIKIAPQATSNLPVSGTIKVDGPAALNLDTTKVTIEGGTVSAVAYNTTDNTWDITYSGLTAGSTYSLVLKTEGMSAVANYPTFAITTAAAAAPVITNILEANGYDYSFENGTYGEAESTITLEVVSQGEGMPAPVHGSKYLKATNRTAGSRNRFKNVGEGKTHQLEAGNTYEISYYVRTIPGEDGSRTTGRAKLYISKTQLSTNTILPGIDSSNLTYVDINSDEWTKISAQIPIINNEGSMSNTSRYNRGIHIGFDVEGTTAVYVDKYEIKEVFPEFTVTPDLQNGATDVPVNKDITISFSNAPTSFTEANVELKIGTTPVTQGISVTPVDSKTFTVSLSGLNELTDYTLKIKDVTDSYGQTADATITFKTVSLVPQPPEIFNILEEDGYDYSFENGTYGEKEGTATLEVVSQGEGMPAPVHGSKYLKATNRAAGSRNRFTRVGEGKTHQLESGNTYEISYYVRTIPGEDGSRTTGKARVYNSITMTSTNTIKPGIETKDFPWTDINSDEWTKITAELPILENEPTSDSPYNRGIHIGFDVEGTTAVYVDNYEVKLLLPEFKLSTTPSSGAANLDLDTELLLTFSNKPWKFDDTMLALKKGTTPVTTGIALEKVDDLNYKVALSGLDIGTTYTLDVVGVIDTYGQSLENAPVTFTTTAAPNLLSEKGLDFSFENGQTSFLTADPSGDFEVIDASDVQIKAPHGSKILKSSGRPANAKVRINTVGGGTENCVEAGKKYIVSFSIRTARDAEGNGTTDKAGVYICNAFPATNTVKPSVVRDVADTDISSEKWTQMSYVVDIVENPYTGTPANSGFHIGARIAGNTTVYIDNFVLKEYIPEFSVTTTPENGADSYGSNTVTYTFTNAPVSFTTGNVSITGGTATVDAVSKVSDTVYAVTFDGFEYSTEYTVSLSGIKDKYDQTVTNEITFTTGSGNPADGNNVLKAGGTDYGFEGTYTAGNFPGAKETNAGETFTVVNAEAEGIEAYEGAQVLKVEAPSTADGIQTSHRFNGIKNGIEIGKQYQISYYARTVNAGESVSATVYTSRSMTTSNNINIEVVSAPKSTVRDTWTKVTAVVKVIENADRTQTAVPYGFHIGVSLNGTSVYIDNYQIFELPADELHISSSTPGADSTGVQIGVGKLILNYSTPLSSGFNPEASGVIKLYKGETDVTEELVTNVAPGFGNGSIEITVGELENGTQYKVVATGVEDYLGRTASSEIVFTTANAITASDSVVKDGTETALDITQVTYDQVSSSSITFANTSASPIDMPLYIYTVYDAAGHLVKTGSTSFGGQIAADGNNITLTHNFDGIDLENKILTLYLVNSFKSLQLASEPVVLDFTNPVQP
ncbi:MAG: carbohydrate binding domain-containing protein [Clostridia bacterium]|nr:carbohydrate binding domain-containing protein [Clostridia bacterium]